MKAVPANPVLVALDVPSIREAVGLAELLRGHVGGYKVGLELLSATGPEAITAVADFEHPVFADVKLHDIPNTVGRAAERLGGHGARWITVHASGGPAMVSAAVEGMSRSNDRGGVLAVTVLTSFDGADLAAVGVGRSVRDQVLSLAQLADSAGAEGVVSSVHETAAVARVAPRLLRVTPGIRRADDSPGDQARIATPADARAAGADLIVVGRPITTASDPVAVAVEMAGSFATKVVDSG